MVEPQGDGRYLARRRGDDGEHLDTPQAAAARATELLPDACGTAILGTAADILASALRCRTGFGSARFTKPPRPAAGSKKLANQQATGIPVGQIH